MVVMKMFPRFSASKVLASAALVLFAFTGVCFADGKVFNKDYTGITSIEATITTHEGVIVVELDFKAAPNTASCSIA